MSKYEKYINAAKDVQENGISCRKAAEKWGVTGTVLKTTTDARALAPVLTKAEEVSLPVG